MRCSGAPDTTAPVLPGDRSRPFLLYETFTTLYTGAGSKPSTWFLLERLVEKWLAFEFRTWYHLCETCNSYRYAHLCLEKIMIQMNCNFQFKLLRSYEHRCLNFTLWSIVQSACTMYLSWELKTRLITHFFASLSVESSIPILYYSLHHRSKPHEFYTLSATTLDVPNLFVQVLAAWSREQEFEAQICECNHERFISLNKVNREMHVMDSTQTSMCT